MNQPKDIRCQKCGKLFAKVTPRPEGGHAVQVGAGGLKIASVNTKERVGSVECSCGYLTLVDLALLGVP